MVCALALLYYRRMYVRPFCLALLQDVWGIETENHKIDGGGTTSGACIIRSI